MTGEPDREAEHTRRRRAMVERQIRRRGVRDRRVLRAMEQVPRHRFVPPHDVDAAYGDHPLPIGEGQTISQPYMVAHMTELAAPRPGDRALEVGAGCGYQTAVLARLCERVFALERIESLVDLARANLSGAGADNVELRCADGTLGWPEHAPFDVILVAAGAPDVPAPLTDQLAEGGRLVIPVGGQDVQELRRITRRGTTLQTTRHTGCRFVDLVGAHGRVPR